MLSLDFVNQSSEKKKTFSTAATGPIVLALQTTKGLNHYTAD